MARYDFRSPRLYVESEFEAGAIVALRRAQVTRVNNERMRANAIEAAEQCGILSPPAVAPLVALSRLLAERDAGRWLVFCDEDYEVANPVDALSVVPPSPLAVLIGPEGG